MGRNHLVGNFPATPEERRFALIQLALHIIGRVGGKLRNVRYIKLTY